ncbi:MAG: transporter substrate-binding domain-containing protein [Actinomycetota bacterium]
MIRSIRKVLAPLGALALGALAVAASESPAGADVTIEPPAERVTVVMTELAPFVENDNGRPDGFYAEIWTAVAMELGVDYEVRWVDGFAELLPSVADGDADVAVAPLAPTATREVGHDFTSAVISSGPQLGYHERLVTEQALWRIMLSTEVRQILIVALLGLIILAHLIWFVERNRGDEEAQDFHPSYVRGIWDGLWWATVTVTTVGYGDKAPRSVPGRAIALLAMLLSLFLVGAFVSQITGVLTANRSDVPIESLDDARSVPVGAVAGSTFAEYLAGEGVAVVGFESQADLFDAMDDGEIDVMVTNPYALAALGPRHGVIATGEVLYQEFETFGLAQDSPWREPLNQALADLQSDGEIEEIIARWTD